MIMIPAKETRIEMTVVHSRFIATAGPAFTVEAARAFVARIKDEFADASHNVSAYLVGHGSTVIAHATDDGEPSGTAGRPALAVLQGSGLGDVAAVVTRYFGGTKLGTGGLVRAYGDAVREVLAALPRAMRVPTDTLSFEAPYSLYDRACLLIEAHHGQILSQDFAVQVRVAVRLASQRASAFAAALRELSNGMIDAKRVESDEATIVPVGALGIASV